jgi:hypothetical protein
MIRRRWLRATAPGGRPCQPRVRHRAPASLRLRHRVCAHPGEQIVGYQRKAVPAVRAQVAREDAANRAHERPGRNVERARADGRPLEQLFGVALELVEHDAHLLPQPRAAGEGLDEQHPTPVRFALHAREQLGERHARRLHPVALSQNALHAGEGSGLGGPISGQQAVFPVLELLVERRAGDPRMGTDLRHAHRLVARPRGQLDHCRDEPLALVGHRLGASDRAAACGSSTSPRARGVGGGRTSRAPAARREARTAARTAASDIAIRKTSPAISCRAGIQRRNCQLT